MDEKIINFFNAQADAVPLDREKLMHILEGFLKNNIEEVWDWIDCSGKLVNDIGLWRDILSCISNRQRCESLIDKLDEEQSIIFSRIVLSIKDAIELDDFSKVSNALFNMKMPTETTISKSALLINNIKNIKEDHLLRNAAYLIQMGNNLKLLGYIYYGFQKSKLDDQWPEKLGQNSEETLDELIRYNELMMDSKG